MRHSLLNLIITYVDMTVAPWKEIIVDSDMSVLKKKGFKVAEEKDDMIIMKGGAKTGWGQVVLIPETHPAFNGGMFVNSTIKGGRRDKTIKEVLTNIVKRAFFS